MNWCCIQPWVAREYLPYYSNVIKTEQAPTLSSAFLMYLLGSLIPLFSSPIILSCCQFTFQCTHSHSIMTKTAKLIPTITGRDIQRLHHHRLCHHHFYRNRHHCTNPPPSLRLPHPAPPLSISPDSERQCQIQRMCYCVMQHLPMHPPRDYYQLHRDVHSGQDHAWSNVVRVRGIAPEFLKLWRWNYQHNHRHLTQVRKMTTMMGWPDQGIRRERSFCIRPKTTFQYHCIRRVIPIQLGVETFVDQFLDALGTHTTGIVLDWLDFSLLTSFTDTTFFGW